MKFWCPGDLEIDGRAGNDVLRERRDASGAVAEQERIRTSVGIDAVAAGDDDAIHEK